MSLGMEPGLGPGDFVLDGDPAPLSRKGAEPPSPIFGPFLLWPNGWMHQDATWYGCRPQPRGLCVRWRHTTPPQKGHGPPFFGPCLLWQNGRPCQLLLSCCYKSSAVAEMGDRGHNRHGPKRGGCCAPFAGAGTPSNTMPSWPRPTSVPSGILIHPAVWPQ